MTHTAVSCFFHIEMHLVMCTTNWNAVSVQETGVILGSAVRTSPTQHSNTQPLRARAPFRVLATNTSQDAEAPTQKQPVNSQRNLSIIARLLSLLRRKYHRAFHIHQTPFHPPSCTLHNAVFPCHFQRPPYFIADFLVNVHRVSLKFLTSLFFFCLFRTRGHGRP